MLGRQRALKFISSELSQDAMFLRRFRREAQAATELQHPNVVQVVDLDQAEDGIPYIAMEFVEGSDLRHALHDGPLPVERALHLARGVALGLGAAHAKGIIHRDVKPENILLTGGSGLQETPKLLDFGIAAMKESATAVSRTHGLMLTPPYAAPEQWRGMASDELDGRADLYALGGFFYEMLTGQTCFHSHNTEGWMYQHLQQEPQPPSLLRPELKNWQGIDELVLRLLAKDRDLRPRDVSELVRLLDEVHYVDPNARQRTVVDARRTHIELPSRFESPEAASEPAPAPAPSHSRRPIWIGAAAFVVVCLGIFGAERYIHSAPATDIPLTNARLSAEQVKNSVDQSAANTQAAARAANSRTPVQAGNTATPQPATNLTAPAPAAPADLYKQGKSAYDSQNYGQARKLFATACDGNEMGACNYLGYLYAQGMGGAKSVPKAQEIYLKACNQGNLLSCASLGTLYQDAGNNSQARIYYQKACDGGKACDLLHALP